VFWSHTPDDDPEFRAVVATVRCDTVSMTDRGTFPTTTVRGTFPTTTVRGTFPTTTVRGTFPTTTARGTFPTTTVRRTIHWPRKRDPQWPSDDAPGVVGQIGERFYPRAVNDGRGSG